MVLAELAEVGKALSGARAFWWAATSLWELVRFLRPRQPDIFGMKWRVYDEEPSPTNSAGYAQLKRFGFREGVRMTLVRHKASSATQEDADFIYSYKGYLRGQKLAMTWEAVDRPDKVGVMFLILNDDWNEMRGHSVYRGKDGHNQFSRKILKKT